MAAQEHHNGWFVSTLDDWLALRITANPSPATTAAYRRDLLGVGGRLAETAGIALGDLTLGEISDRRRLTRAFASWAADHAPASVRRAHSAWSSFFDHLVADGVTAGNPMAAVPKPRPPSNAPRALRGHDPVAAVLRAAARPDERSRSAWPARDVAIVAVFAVAGLRLAELVGLDIGDLDGPDGDQVLYVTGKGGKHRTVPVAPPLETLLRRWLADREAALERPPDPRVPLFVARDGERLTRWQVQYLVGRTYRRAGLGGAKPDGALVHALRHTFASQALRGGVNLVEIQQLLGHASLDTTRRYLSQEPQHLKEAVRANPAAHQAAAALRAGDA